MITNIFLYYSRFINWLNLIEFLLITLIEIGLFVIFLFGLVSFYFDSFFSFILPLIFYKLFQFIMFILKKMIVQHTKIVDVVTKQLWFFLWTWKWIFSLKMIIKNKYYFWTHVFNQIIFSERLVLKLLLISFTMSDFCNIFVAVQCFESEQCFP